MKKILVFLISFLCVIGSVKAEKVTLTKDVYNNTYVYYYDSNMGKTRYLHASKYLFGDTAAYCIELGKDISSFDYTMTNSFDGINISNEDLEYIKLVSYYGYNYPGHNTDKYYMATQSLIWKRLARTSIKFIIGFDPDNFYNLTDEETSITVLVNKHYIKPSFDGSTITFVKGKEMIIEDTNNVLDSYYSDDDNVVIDGNKLIVKKNFGSTTINLKRHNYTNKEFFLYTSGNSQKMMSAGGITNATSNVNVKVISGSIELRKYDKDNGTDKPSGEATLYGAEYGLYDFDGNLIDTFVTMVKDKIEGLPIGDYYIKEITPSRGYMIDENIHVIYITEDNLNVVKTVYDEVIKGRVEIFKVLSTDETGILVGESNVQFDIYDTFDNLVTSIVTESDGYADVTLPYGCYRFHQVNTIEGYYTVDDFDVGIYYPSDRPIHKLLSDGKIKAKVRVIKKDAETSRNIINGKAQFKIYNVDKKEYVSFKVNYPRKEIIDTFDINSEGTFTTPYELEAGNYILYEVDAAMDNYLYNSGGIPFTIGKNMDCIREGDDVVVELVFYNKLAVGSLTIHKYGEKIKYDNDSYYYESDKLDGAIFRIYADEDIYVNGLLVSPKDNIVSEVMSKDGICYFGDLYIGSYYFMEVSSSEGNVVDPNIYKVKVEYKDQYTEEIAYDININNYLPKGKLIINKYETGIKKKISNTLIEIRNSDNNNIVYKGYTDENGMIELDDMLYGKYYLSEVEASTGYRLLEDKIYFEIEEEETIVDVYNERIEVPNTGIGVDYKDILVLISIVLISIGMILFRNNKYYLIFGIVIICLAVFYFGFKFYNYYSDIKNNDKAVEAVLKKRIDSINNEKYRYKAVLDIPSINLKRGILDIDNKYNKAKYNIELVKEGDNLIVLASHNGNNYNSYFGKLKDMELSDTIDYYYDGKIYRYIYTDDYEIRKDGYADIYRKDNEKAIVLVTCKDNSSDGQIVFVGYLSEVLEY